MKLTIKIDDQTFEVEVGDLNARPVLAVIDGETFSVWPEETAQGNGRSESVNGRSESANGRSESEQAAGPIAIQPAVASASSRPAAAGNGAEKGKTVPAPIPGVIISVAVKEGDSVAFGQELCVLEAMKMKNIIRANRPGKVARVCVATGDQVKHGQPLIEYSE